MAELQTPSELLGDLFTEVQSRRLFADSKSFADAIARYDPAEIVAKWRGLGPLDDAALRSFIADHFEIPPAAQVRDVPDRDFETYLAAALGALVHEPKRLSALGSSAAGTATADLGSRGSALSMPHPFLVPGGRFREFYYWDSYFAMLGMAGGRDQHRIEDMIENFGSLLDRYGMIPNGSRSYYLSRSHPPVFYLAARLSADDSVKARLRRLGWMRKEHEFWMMGEVGLTPGSARYHVVCMADGAILNRYWDNLARPRDESWLEDVTLAKDLPEADRPALWRNLRAGAESGWDFSSRWLADAASLASLNVTRILPVDLNCLLWGLETEIAAESAALGLGRQADIFKRRARNRSAAIERYLWNADKGYHADYWLDQQAVSDRLTAAAAFPLFVGQCSAIKAQATARALEGLLALGGLLATPVSTGQQWDAPNGWAPLQWVAFVGLQHYGETALADEIARRWVALVHQHYEMSGQIMEKYDVVGCRAGGGGEYPVEIGFGWTNGVTLSLLRHLRSAACDIAC